MRADRVAAQATRRQREGVPRHQTVRAVVKATQVLCCVAENEQMTVAEVAAALELPPQTVYNLLNTLLAEGMLSRDAARRYRLGPKIATLAVAYARIGPSQQLLKVLRNLAATTGETTYLSTWRNGEVVALATVEGSNAVRVGSGIHVELRGAEHARASGKVMLAHVARETLDAYVGSHKLEPRTPRTIIDEQALRNQLKTIRRRGYAVDEGEFLESVGCVAAPIFESTTCVAGIGLSAPLRRFQANRARLIDAVTSAANEGSNV